MPKASSAVVPTREDADRANAISEGIGDAYARGYAKTWLYGSILNAQQAARRETIEAIARDVLAWGEEVRVEVDGTSLVRNPIEVHAARTLARRIREAALSVSVDNKETKDKTP